MTPKRSRSPADDSEPEAKRHRAEQNPFDVTETIGHDSRAVKSLMPTQHSQARAGIQRSIALVLNHDGFGSASPEALESFTEMVETCTPTSCASLYDC